MLSSADMGRPRPAKQDTGAIIWEEYSCNTIKRDQLGNVNLSAEYSHRSSDLSPLVLRTISFQKIELVLGTGLRGYAFCSRACLQRCWIRFDFGIGPDYLKVASK